MTDIWPALIAVLGAHPRATLALAAATAAAAWAVHVWRLRRRERHLVVLVDERTRLWQEEVAAHAKLRALVEAATPAGADHDRDRARVRRVLVVGERRDRREAVTAVLDGLGIAPVFADSPWAAKVATHAADADGEPYDLILIDSAMEGRGVDGAPADLEAAP